MALTVFSSFLLFGCADADDTELDETTADEMAEESDIEALDDDYGFSDWDIDTDRALDRDEWSTWSADYDWSAWNTDAEEGLDEEEFGTTTLTLWDLDDDDRVSEAGASGTAISADTRPCREPTAPSGAGGWDVRRCENARIGHPSFGFPPNVGDTVIRVSVVEDHRAHEGDHRGFPLPSR